MGAGYVCSSVVTSLPSIHKALCLMLATKNDDDEKDDDDVDK